MKRVFVQLPTFAVLYLDLPRIEKTLLLYLYGKDEAEDLTSEQKQQFAAMVRVIKGNLER